MSNPRQSPRSGCGCLPFFLVVVLLLGLTVVLVPPVRVAAQSLLVLPAFFPNPPLDPLTAFTKKPIRTEHAFDYAAGRVDMDVYSPDSTDTVGAVMLYLGPNPVPRRNTTLVRFAEGLARSGLVVAVPESSALMAGRVTPEEEEAIRKSFDIVAGLPRVDKQRVGIIAFSVGGSLSMVAASHPEMRDRVRFINTLGSYYDATDLVIDIVSRSQVIDGQTIPWEPDPLPKQVLADQIISALSVSRDRELLTQVFLRGQPLEPAQMLTMSFEGIAAHALLSGVPREQATSMAALLPASVKQRLDAISPSKVLPNLRTKLYLMHDVGDAFIPYSQTRKLAAAAPAGLVARYTEFNIFSHVIPDRPVAWTVFLPDLAALFRQVHEVMSEVL